MARVKIQVPVQPVAAQVSAPSQTPALPLSRSSKRTLIGGGLAIIVLIMLIVLAALLQQKRHLEQEVSKLSSSQTSSGAPDVQKVTTAVAKLVDVPQNVTPDVKTADDSAVAKLIKSSAVYKDAKSGDIFLVYNLPDKSVFLVIYRQSQNKVILAAPFSAPAPAK